MPREKGKKKKAVAKEPTQAQRQTVNVKIDLSGAKRAGKKKKKAGARGGVAAPAAAFRPIDIFRGGGGSVSVVNNQPPIVFPGSSDSGLSRRIDDLAMRMMMLYNDREARMERAAEEPVNVKVNAGTSPAPAPMISDTFDSFMGSTPMPAPAPAPTPIPLSNNFDSFMGEESPAPSLSFGVSEGPVAGLPPPESPQVKPEFLEVKPESPEVKPESPKVKPESPKVKPEPPPEESPFYGSVDDINQGRVPVVPAETDVYDGELPGQFIPKRTKAWKDRSTPEKKAFARRLHAVDTIWYRIRETNYDPTGKSTDEVIKYVRKRLKENGQKNAGQWKPSENYVRMPAALVLSPGKEYSDSEAAQSFATSSGTRAQRATPRTSDKSTLRQVNLFELLDKVPMEDETDAFAPSFQLARTPPGGASKQLPSVDGKGMKRGKPPKPQDSLPFDDPVMQQAFS